MFLGKRIIISLMLATVPLTGCVSQEEYNRAFVDVDLDTLSEFQREILADGVVTYAEYEKAVSAEYECVKDVYPNRTMGPIEPTRGQLAYTVETSFDEDMSAKEIAAVDAADFKCRETYLEPVASKWASQDVPDADEREKMRPEVMACFAAAGLAVDASTTDEQFQSASEAYVTSIQNEDVEPSGETEAKMEALQACQEKHYRFFTFIPEKSN